MGLMSWLVGGGARAVGNTVEQVHDTFRPNAEKSAQRASDYNQAALAQYAAEFHARANRTWFDSLVDGLNRLARPLITMSVLGMLPAAMFFPEDTAVAIQAIQLLPTGYWALLSVIIGFYYGGRMQIKSHDFQKSITEAVARAPQVIDNMKRLRDHLSPEEAADDDPEVAQAVSGALPVTNNKAVQDWRKKAGL